MRGYTASVGDQLALELATSLGSGKYALEDLYCEESLSNPFELTLTLTSNNLNVDLESVIGKSVTALVRAKPKKRYFNGVVSHISQTEIWERNKLCSYQVTLRPLFWFLTLSKDYRIFQKKNAQTIIKDVLQKYGVTQVDDRTQSCGRTVREYCVQYGESHFDFVSRLMEEEGIFYYFEHDQGKHTLVLGDKPSAHKNCKGVSDVEMNFALSEQVLLNRVTLCHINQSAIAKEHSLTDYNYMTPKTKLFAKAKGAGKKGEVYVYPGAVDIEYKPTKGGNESFSNLRSEQSDWGQEEIWGDSTCPFFETGSGFTLKKHLRKSANKRYILGSVVHRASIVNIDQDGKETQVNELAPDPATTRISYGNQFHAFPAKVVYRPPQKTEKPRIHGTQTAVVTGPKGEEIHTDDQRRIKVQFHWDREGKKDEKSTCWVRVSQGWASNKWGILFTPRIGMEVVVSFINGDPDRPLVTGCVYNADNTPPYGAKDKTMATIKSDTHKGKGSGFNELRFEDKKKKEEIYLHAEKDWNTHVLENRTTVMEKGSDFKTIKKGDREVVIKGQPGAVAKKGEAPSLKHSGKGASKKGNDLLTIERGSRIVKIMGMGSGQGSYKTTIMKGDRDLQIMKGNNKDTFMKGNDTRTLLKGNQSLMIAEGNKSQIIGKGNESSMIGQGNKSLIMGQGNKTNIIGSGNDTLLIPGGMKTAIMQGLLLKVGGFVLAIGGGGSGTEETMPGHKPDQPGEPNSQPESLGGIGLGGASGGGEASNCVDVNATSQCGDINLTFLDSNITINQNGEKKIQVSKSYQETVGMKYTLDVAEEIVIKCKGDIKFEGKNIEFKALKDFKVDATQVDVVAKSKIGLNSSGVIETLSSAITKIKAALIKLN